MQVVQHNDSAVFQSLPSENNKESGYCILFLIMFLAGLEYSLSSATYYDIYAVTYVPLIVWS
jgi:hypothetical protein